MVKAGFDVYTIAPADEYSYRLADLGANHISVPMDKGGTNPLRDLGLLLQLWKTFRSIRPAVVLGFTAKPNIYGGMAAHMLGIPIINNIAGLGAAFSRDNWLTWLVRHLYGRALSKSYKVFFQNLDDQHQFIKAGLVSTDRTGRLPGSGVDLQHFCLDEQAAHASHRPNGPMRFTLIARMLWDKGVGEFVEAARQLKADGHSIDCCIVGFEDADNPESIPKSTIDTWVNSGAVRYLGRSDQISEVLAQAQCVVLPSYYKEGVPRSLLEAAAMQRPIITTDLSGCRDAVDNGVSGLLCKPRDPTDLKRQMKHMLDLSESEREAMGWAGRQKVEREFNEDFVIKAYLQAIQAATQGSIRKV